MASRRPAGSAPEAGRISTAGGTHCRLVPLGHAQHEHGHPTGLPRAFSANRPERATKWRGHSCLRREGRAGRNACPTLDRHGALRAVGAIQPSLGRESQVPPPASLPRCRRGPRADPRLPLGWTQRVAAQERTPRHCISPRLGILPVTGTSNRSGAAPGEQSQTKDPNDEQ